MTPPTARPEVLRAARDTLARRDWPRAHELLTAARAEEELAADDLDSLSRAAWWMGRSAECIEAGEAAYRAHLGDGDPGRAARSAIEVALEHLLRGEESAGSAWIRRAEQLLDGLPECAEHGLLLFLTEVEGPLLGGDGCPSPALDALADASRRVAEIGRRHGDADLAASGVLGEGRALVKGGRVSEGLRLLDEAMLAVVAGELSPEWAGNVYCHLMSAAHELVDVQRSVEWTTATARWLEDLPAAVLFRGICRVHRSQVHQLKGSWERAEDEAARVCRDLAELQPASAAEAHYQLGEIHRLRGDLPGAERSYHHAHRLGRDPQPGLALLRLRQGRGEAASTSIRSALAGAADDLLAAAPLLAAQVEISLATGEVPLARKAGEELADVAAAFGSSGLEVMARRARGAILLAEGHPARALPVLRDACRRWQELEAPYECARVRLLLASTYQALGDQDAAALELEAATEVFEHLGAAGDLEEVAELSADAPALPGGLTPREAEVLALVAVGGSNREVAAALHISQKTVARHLSNIFTKLGLTSRTAAAAYAFAHNLASPTGW